MDQHADLGCIAETGVGKEGGILLPELCPPGFMIQWQPRLGGWGGSVAVVYKSNMSLTRWWFRNLQSMNVFTWCWVTKTEWDCYMCTEPPAAQWPPCQSCWGRSQMWCWRPLDNVYWVTSISTLRLQLLKRLRTVAAMATMGQLISGPAHQAGHTLDFVFCPDQTSGNLKMGYVVVSPLSWSNHYLVNFKLAIPPCLCIGE